MELEDLTQKFKEACSFTDCVSRITALENFKELTDSSEIPDFLKKRLKARANEIIKCSVDGALEELFEDEFHN